MSWQPISTAPRDGTSFIAALEVTNNVTKRKYWDIHIIFIDTDTDTIDIDCDQGWGIEDYTHWQPLPKPPKFTPDIAAHLSRQPPEDAGLPSDTGSPS